MDGAQGSTSEDDPSSTACPSSRTAVDPEIVPLTKLPHVELIDAIKAEHSLVHLTAPDDANELSAKYYQLSRTWLEIEVTQLSTSQSFS